MIAQQAKITSNALEASYELAYLIAQTKKPHRIGETLIKPAAVAMCRVIHVEKIANELMTVPLSNDKVARCVHDIAKDIKSQLIDRINGKKYALQVDESTDVSNSAQLLAFIKYIFDGKLHEDMLFCSALEGTRGDPRWRREWPPCCKLRENCAVFRMFYLFFLLFYMLDVVSITVYDRDTLLNIGCSVTQRKPDFEFLNAGGLFTDTASEPFVWVVQSRKRRRCRKRGKRAGVLVRLRRRAFRPPLPTILLAKVQSLDNKLCELRARISYQRETRDCCVICLTETWMSAMVPDSAIELTGFSVHRSDRAKELTGKSRGGGVCFYINNSWCNERNIHY